MRSLTLEERKGGGTSEETSLQTHRVVNNNTAGDISPQSQQRFAPMFSFLLSGTMTRRHLALAPQKLLVDVSVTEQEYEHKEHISASEIVRGMRRDQHHIMYESLHMTPITTT